MIVSVKQQVNKFMNGKYKKKTNIKTQAYYCHFLDDKINIENFD